MHPLACGGYLPFPAIGAEWLLKIVKAHKEDITVNLHHIMDFDPKKKGRPFELRILNSDKVVHSMGELVPEAGLLLREGGNA